MNQHAGIRRGWVTQIVILLLGFIALQFMKYLPEFMMVAGVGTCLSTMAVAACALVMTLILRKRKPRTRRIVMVISLIAIPVGIVAHLLFFSSGPVIMVPPIFLSYLAGGAVLSMVTVPTSYVGKGQHPAA